MRNRIFLAAALASATLAADNPVFFQDGFESGDLSGWSNGDSDYKDPDLAIVTNPADVHSGKSALCITARPGEGTGGKLPFWFMPGRDQVYCRWYQRWAPDFDQGNLCHGVHLLGNRIDNKWSAFGKAGIKPNGTDFCSVGFEPWRNWGRHPAPGQMMFYAYYPDMKPAPGGQYWGNMLFTDPAVLIERGRWYCLEMMVKLSTPGQKDGELACWVDGEPTGKWIDLRWRDSTDVRLNCFQLLNYIHQCTQPCRVYFDDVVLSSEYIGPQQAEGGQGG
ncbi:MAG: hypothetical protein HYU66_20475 [Armatimonadetes bacterium]|nr:hypothetical protein [Armatimonadota bacterium]